MSEITAKLSLQSSFNGSDGAVKSPKKMPKNNCKTAIMVATIPLINEINPNIHNIIVEDANTNNNEVITGS